ncbi:MAG: tRNA epoxyqueuosine(34) reductase QueG, partial [Betaproteobacteria bacterium]|nr:tRNA epoxyqueuosine(34) reductase QueG [Betaproteobacteria bacterium]
GNRIFGCDDCQLVCPWNKYAQRAELAELLPRRAQAPGSSGLDTATLVELFRWDGSEFDDRTAGSAIRRIGAERWLRNVAVALGNAPTSEAVLAALHSRADHPSALVREHVAWALAQHAAHTPPPGPQPSAHE